MESLFVLASLAVFSETFWDMIESLNWKKIICNVALAVGIYIEEKYL